MIKMIEYESYYFKDDRKHKGPLMSGCSIPKDADGVCRNIRFVKCDFHPCCADIKFEGCEFVDCDGDDYLNLGGK
jgi:hypothetical protein